MSEDKLRNKLDQMTGDLFQDIQDQIGDHLESITLTGSYAIGKISISRPDINFFIVLKPRVPADVYLRMGEIFTKIIHKYSADFSIRPEFRPFKYPNPIYEKGLEVFLNPVIASIEEKDGDFPFGVSKNFLAGVKSMRKVIFGKDVLADMDFKIDKQYIIQASFRDVSLFKIQLTRAPMSYDLNSKIGLLLNESLINGKMAMGYGVELASTPEELENRSYLQYFSEREKMVGFYRERFGESVAENAQVLQDARNNYHEWKEDKEKTYAVFSAAYYLTMAVWSKLLSIAFGGGH